ncbi:MAG: hypothetical protein WC551_11210 [Patescibacteria group bacterium]
MIFALELGPEFQRTVSDLSEAGKNVRAAAGEGLAEGVTLAASHVSENYLTGQYLKRRTGRLAAAVQGWMTGDLDGVVGVAEGTAVERYKYLLGDETVTIRPKRAKYLAVPIGEALSGSGAVKEKYADGPGKIWDAEKLFIVQGKGQPLVGYKVGKRGRFRPLYVLKKEVTVYGTGALYDGVEESIPEITGTINRKLDEKMN